MSPTLRFSPLPNSIPFETVEVDLVGGVNKPFLIGLRFDESASQSTPTANNFDVVPVDSSEAKQMKHPFAAVWLTPGYKVLVSPAEGGRMYFQRAIADNHKWTKIKPGWRFDLADPLMTILDQAVHIKFDNSAIGSRRAEFLKQLHHIFHPSDDEKSLRHIHNEVEGLEEHLASNSLDQVSARVTVNWENIRERNSTPKQPFPIHPSKATTDDPPSTTEDKVATEDEGVKSTSSEPLPDPECASDSEQAEASTPVALDDLESESPTVMAMQMAMVE